jgi:predicted dithiol-disulfide oxidoreductase (DUF899 family)
MEYKEASKKVRQLQKDMQKLRKEMTKARKSAKPEEVKNYTFKRSSGQEVKLTELFGDKEHLILIHNMGADCPYCTLWADGFNGVFDHLNDRAAFALSSPDEPAKQRKFAESRGWRFPVVSHSGTSFAKDMGYAGEKGFMPGVSAFARKNGKVYRVADDSFGPGDDFCIVWPFFDLLPDGSADWSPKYKY